MKKFVYNFPRPLVTCDVVLFTKIKKRLHVLLVKRANPPFKNRWALPGGFINMDETLEKTALRELEEETGLRNVKIKQFYAFGDPGRDPRGRTITIAYLSHTPYHKIKLRSGSDAKEASLFDVKNLPPLAFDHKKIILHALKELGCR
jgi:8-oxo-dGTP diphosphatase